MALISKTILGVASFTKNNIDKKFLQRIDLDNIKIILKNQNVLIASSIDIRELKLLENDGNLSLFWGRLYNKDHSFKFDFLNKLSQIQGSFHYIQYDKCKKEINFTNDKYGFRRLLYYLKDDIFYFSNTLQGLKILLQKLPSICEDSLLHYYTFGVTSNNKTLNDGINKLPPGTTITFKNNKIKTKTYFNLHDLYKPDELIELNETDLINKINISLLDSVKMRISNSEHVGVSLSGGVDSGFIAQKITESGNSVTGYNLAYKDYYDEYERVDYITQKLNIPLKKIRVGADEIINNFHQVNKYSSEPVGFNNASLNLLFIQASKDGIKTLFDGDGTDRLFLGMNRYLLYKKAIILYNILSKTKTLALAEHLLNHSKNNEFKKLNILFNNWNNGICPYPERELGVNQKYDYDYERIIYEIGVKQHRENFLQTFGAKDFGLYFTYQAVQMCPEMFFYDPFEIQSRLGMCPMPAFFDDSLVSIAISIPTKLKLRKKSTKYILRKAASNNINRKYWMLPKIGLDNSFKFIKKTKSGSNWIKMQNEKVKDSIEYNILKRIAPRELLDTNKLIGFITWRENNI